LMELMFQVAMRMTGKTSAKRREFNWA
jgi:hypothetical protein